MKEKMYYYDFTLIPRMWIMPDSRGIAEDDHYTLLKWRNKLSVFVRHWLDLWYSWKLVGRWLIVPGLLIFAVTGSLVASGIVIGISLLLEIMSRRRISLYRKLTMLVEGLIDSKLEEHYGPLPPLTYKYDE